MSKIISQRTLNVFWSIGKWDYFILIEFIYLSGLYYRYLEVSVAQWSWSYEMGTAIRVQNLDEADCISHRTNIFGKGMNPIILPPAMGK